MFGAKLAHNRRLTWRAIGAQQYLSRGSFKKMAYDDTAESLPRRSTEELLGDARQRQLLGAFARAPRQRLSIDGIEQLLHDPIPRRSLQRLLAEAVEHGLVKRHGERRGTRYELQVVAEWRPGSIHRGLQVTEPTIPNSLEGAYVRDVVRLPQHLRTPVGYRAQFLDDYVPNGTFYLTAKQRSDLRAMGNPPGDTTPAAGTFANDILDRLLIDLSFSSSRLEGNTYSLLDTQHLIEHGEVAEGKDALETKMILNHKDAIEFLVRDPSCGQVSAGAIKGLHAFLSDGLLPDAADIGRLRDRAVGITGSVYKPLALGAHIEEQFELLVAKAAAIRDPFEQALFLMVQLPYLQPFMDVNKRVSRLAANIPLVQANLCPLSFLDVPTDAYVDATLGVYELNRTELLRDVFVHAYERSCQQYAAAKQSLRPPDAFRNRFRRQAGEAIAAVVRADLPATRGSIEQHVPADVPEAGRARFVALVLSEFATLNADSAVRFGLRPLEFQAWLDVQPKA
jgi:hypothetical protein